MATFSRLIRFIAQEDDEPHNGDAILPPNTTDASLATSAREITGPILPLSSPPSYTITDRVLTIKTLLPPIDPLSIRTVRCLGLNYAAHARETGAQPPPNFPPLFYKPSTAISSARSPIPIAYPHQSNPSTIDYEVELVVIIGKTCLNVPTSSALDYVLGYTVGNDVSHRALQMQPGGGGQWGLGKSSDGWGPIGPAIVSKELIPDPQKLRVRTKVNGEIRQDSTTADMIYPVAEIVSKLSIGTTLLPGDVIFTGTPAGVAMGRAGFPPKKTDTNSSGGKNPYYLHDGDLVEVWMENVGTCSNRIEYQGQKGESKL